MEHAFTIQIFCANLGSVKKKLDFLMNMFRKLQFSVIFPLFLRKCQIRPLCTPLHGLHAFFWSVSCLGHHISEILSYGKYMVTMKKKGENWVFVSPIKYGDFGPLGLEAKPN